MERAAPRRPSVIRFTMVAVATCCLVAGVTSCGSSTETMTSPSGSRCALQTQVESTAFPPAGGAGTLRVTTNRECVWSARSDAAWLTLASTASGQGEGTIQFTVAANSNPSPRSAGLGVNDERVQISQTGRPCEFGLSSTRESADATGGDRTILVTSSSPECRWTAVSAVPWITVVSGFEGGGNGSVTFRVSAIGELPRTGTLTIAGQTVQVEQGTDCSYTVGTSAFSLNAAGGFRDVPVSAAPGCAWMAESQVPWITLTGSSTGTGSGVVGFQVAPSDGTARTGTLAVAGQIITVAQSASSLPPPPPSPPSPSPPQCSFTVAPSSYSVPAGGGPRVITVGAGAGCAWTAASSADWVTVTAGQSGTGPGEVHLSVAASNSPARTATIRIAEQIVTIAQAGNCTFALNPSSVAAAAAGVSGTIQVTGGAGCAWSASSGAAWLAVTGGAAGSGSGQLQYAVAPNQGPARQSTLTIAGLTLPVTQASGCTYGISAPSSDVAGAGGSGAVSVATFAGCTWSAASNAGWLSVSAATGTGPGEVQFTASPNPGPPRSGTLSVAGQIVTVSQTSPCTWKFAPPSLSFDAAAGAGSVNVIVTGTIACTWTAASTAAWITGVSITPGPEGVGNALVQFSVAPNTGPARTGIVTIGGESYVVMQAAP